MLSSDGLILRICLLSSWGDWILWVNGSWKDELPSSCLTFFLPLLSSASFKSTIRCWYGRLDHWYSHLGISKRVHDQLPPEKGQSLRFYFFFTNFIHVFLHLLLWQCWYSSVYELVSLFCWTHKIAAWHHISQISFYWVKTQLLICFCNLRIFLYICHLCCWYINTVVGGKKQQKTKDFATFS